MKLKEILSVIGGLVALLITAFGVNSHLETKYALAEQQQIIKQTIQSNKKDNDYRFLAIRYQTIKDMIYKLKERYLEKKMDQTGKDMLKKLEDDKADIESEMQKLKDQK